ncbi:coagulation factor X [Drosophila ficusphila]|uniref:coagulation factor X n=1 Tax=Drosophila ficusphila TaxID=30025 RepID=UPI0007E812E4|nr:coagulation factor X [Drosophila ficusphila]
MKNINSVAVLASLLILYSEAGSADLLFEKCGGMRGNPTETLGPWTALLHENGTIFCAGTLITNLFVLTTASCIKANKTVKVRLGQFGRDRGEFPEDHMVRFSLRYRYFNKGIPGNDIGLLKLTKQVDLKDHISPVCIILGSQQRSVYDFIGSAWNQIKDEYIAMELRPIRIRPNSQYCQELNVYNQFCAGHPFNSGSCDGITGSALIQNYRNTNQESAAQLIGIATADNMECQGAQAYTNVTELQVWIASVVSVFTLYNPTSSYLASQFSEQIFA